jgi:hypothetical protein
MPTQPTPLRIQKVRLLGLLALVLFSLALPPAARGEGWVEPEEEKGVAVGISLPCSAPTTIALTIHWATSGSRTLTNSWCGGGKLLSEGLEWGGSEAGLQMEERGPALLALINSHHHKTHYVIFFSFAVNGVYAESGFVTISSTYWPATRIWEGEDAFVNYCIDKDHEITSINHRLGCYEPSLRSIISKVTWAHPG